MASETMNAAEAGAFLHLHPESVKRAARAGLLPASKTGRKWLFLRADLEAWLRAGGTRYEALVDAGLAKVCEERMADPQGWLSEDEVKAGLGL